MENRRWRRMWQDGRSRRNLVRMGRIAPLMLAVVLLVATSGSVMAVPAKPAFQTLQYKHPFPSSSGSGASQTSGKPGIAVCHGEFYVAWTGDAAPYHMLISHTTNPFNTGSWSTPQVLNDTALRLTGPALTCYLNRLYVAWAGTDGANHIYIGYYTDGNAALHNHTALSKTTTQAPDMAPSSSDGKLYLVWRGHDYTNLYLASSRDGSTFGGSIVFGDTSPLGPSIGEVVFNGQYYLYLAWQGTGNTQYIWTGYFNGSSALQNHTNTGVVVNKEPDLVSIGSTLCVLYSQPGLNMAQSRTTDGAFWFLRQTYEQWDRMSATEDAGNIWVAVRGPATAQVFVGEAI
jgi:hypothetical protein